ncbi:hypothetical protein [Azospirillum sp. B506]|uniref:hypothetical protein n=1 Tax=Azospirillum sp. B506 TaxID=137721 RepID=UPI0011DCCD4F|nr:hypothetical protein [Azospirillum sp. B506]
MRVYPSGKAALAYNVPVGAIFLARVVDQPAYFIKGSYTEHPEDTPEKIYINLTEISGHRESIPSIRSSGFLNTGPVLILNNSVEIAVDINSVASPNDTFSPGNIMYFDAVPHLLYDGGAINLTNGEVKRSDTSSARIAFSRWSIVDREAGREVILATFPSHERITAPHLQP